MRRWQAALAFAATGLSLLAVAVARSGTATEGGTLRVNISDSDLASVDPAVGYDLVGWAIEYATCLKLLNYPDRPGPAGVRLVPEAAAAMPAVSRDGRTYTFRIRPGLRFNTGEAVTAATFAHVFRRTRSPKLKSPAAAFLRDVAGVRASGATLRITLTKPLADILARVAMPFFCAVPLDYPIDPRLTKAPASAGPYYIAERIPRRTISLKRNPYYHGPRPHHLDEIAFAANTNSQASYLQIKAAQADYDLSPALPPQQAALLAKEFGVNRSRYFVSTQNALDYLAFNMSRPLFAEAALRKAVNYAIDRPALLRQFGLHAGVATDQILPPGVPGYRDARIYPLDRPNVAWARRLAAGKGGNAVVLFPNVPPVAGQVQVLTSNLAQIGITLKPRPLAVPAYLAALGDPNEGWDLAIAGWGADYPDPYDFLNVLFDSANVPPAGANFSRMKDAAFDRRLRTAASFRGEARYVAYGRLDADLMRTVAPVAPIANRTVREFLSARFGCHLFQQALGIVDFAAACIK
jgi:ABC-type oligopeptide transport system substrate-binding subunit